MPRHPQRVTVVDTLDEDNAWRYARVAPHAARIFTTADRQVRYIDLPGERIVAADAWGVSRETLCELVREYGPGYSYISPSGFAYSLWTKRYAPPGYILRTDDWRGTMARAALYGGRCEVYQYVKDTPAHQYDINGSYPYAATQLTFPDIRSYHYTPVPTIENIWYYEGVSHVTFSQEGSHPCLPVRFAGRVLYPNADHVAGTFTHTELRYALHHAPGIRIHRLEKQFIGDRPLAANPFAAFVEFCFNERSKQPGPLWKLIVNGLFGRLAVADSAGLWAFTPYPETTPGEFRRLPDRVKGYFGVCCTGAPTTAPPRSNPLWAAMVLAQARNRLHSLIDPRTLYVDTDCLVCRETRDLPLSPDLGAFKYKFGSYHIRGTKMYSVTTPDGATDLKYRGKAKAWRTEADLFAAEATQERIVYPDGHTAPQFVSGYAM